MDNLVSYRKKNVFYMHGMNRCTKTKSAKKKTPAYGRIRGREILDCATSVGL